MAEPFGAPRRARNAFTPPKSGGEQKYPSGIFLRGNPIKRFPEVTLYNP